MVLKGIIQSYFENADNFVGHIVGMNQRQDIVLVEQHFRSGLRP